MRLVIVSILLSLVPNLQAKPVNRKLIEIKKEILATRREIRNYQKTEVRLQKDVEFLKRKNLNNQKNLKRLSELEKSLKKKEKKLSLQLESLREDSDFWSQQLQKNLRVYLADLEDAGEYQSIDFLQQEEFLRFSLINEAAMLKALGGSARKTARAKQKTDAVKLGIIAQSRRTFVQNQKVSASYAQEKSLIKSISEKKAQTLKKEKKLEESEKALTLLLKKFSRRRKIKRTTRRYHPQAAIGPHSLPWPVQGKVVEFFGKQKNAELETWVIHQGILIKTAPHSTVRSVASGRVIFAGPFRSYGQIVIMDCGREFFVIYGHLGSILVKTGSFVGVRQIIGTSSEGAHSGNLYFELRHRTTALNPLGWLKR